MHNLEEYQMLNSPPVVLVSSGSTNGSMELKQGDIVEVGTDRWYKWLADNPSFRFESGFAGEKSFTARKHERDTNDFWYAYRKIGGKAKSCYLGKTEQLTAEKLLVAAAKLAELAESKAEDQRLGNGYAKDCTTSEIGNGYAKVVQPSEDQQKLEEEVRVLAQENDQLKQELQKLEDQVARLKAQDENRKSVLAVAMENIKSNAASKLIKAVKELYPELG